VNQPVCIDARHAKAGHRYPDGPVLAARLGRTRAYCPKCRSRDVANIYGDVSYEASFQ